MKRHRTGWAFSLVEITIATALLSSSVIAFVGAQQQQARNQLQLEQLVQAQQAARTYLEEIRLAAADGAGHLQRFRPESLSPWLRPALGRLPRVRVETRISRRRGDLHEVEVAVHWGGQGRTGRTFTLHSLVRSRP